MKTRKQLTPEQALYRLQTLCARAEHCTFELRQKLERWQINAGDARSIMEQLVAERYVDDRRYARSYTGDAVKFGRRGRLYIRQHLMAKRINPDIIAEALDEAIDPEVYNANLRKLVAALQADDEQSATPAGRQRVLRRALSRGYTPSEVLPLLDTRY